MTAPKLTGNRCQCTACGEYFNGVQPFDRHRVGSFGTDRRCLDVQAMEAAGFVRNAAGFWTSEARAQRAARQRAAAIPAHRTHAVRVGQYPVTVAAQNPQAGMS
ncbi:hypothetical protein B0E52_09865 [Rhodanobacter sp. C06]|uniref:FDXHR family putative zinc-binding protein n=1 Tax=Rhodanobacter sp. C06 TaxID=1945854 RepID=UPI000984D9EB|nr:hypothetical protein [Rhodanobacter sp. C06]OOG43233.1 hypothetical protein B0E52_09865 [Rhodanobacter sp. C06]